MSVSKRRMGRVVAALSVIVLTTAGVNVVTQTPASASEGFVPIAAEPPHAPGEMATRPPKANPATDPKPVGVKDEKGFPGTKTVKSPADKASSTSAATTYYFTYAGTRKSIVTLGASANFTIHNPFVSTADAHSLAEISLQNGGNIVEVGWTKEPGQPPKLFTYAWKDVNGVRTPTCYNGCGYVDNPNVSTHYAGMDLTSVVGQSKMFYMERYDNVWWIAYDNQWIGYWPDSVFSPTKPFLQADLVQFFGELAGRSTATICSDMGKGVSPSGSPSTAATMTNLHIVNQTGVDTFPSTFRDPSSGIPASWYNIYPINTTDSRNYYYGGPLSC